MTHYGNGEMSIMVKAQHYVQKKKNKKSGSIPIMIVLVFNLIIQKIEPGFRAACPP